MKKTMLAIAFASMAFAGVNTASAEGYNRVGLSYDLESMSASDDTYNLNGFGVSYIHGFGVSASHPMFVETGIKMYTGFYGDKIMGFYDDDIMNVNMNITKLTFEVPVNFTYKFPFAANKMAISPYAGLNFKFNTVADLKMSAGGYSETVSMFDKDGMDANVVQLGWHIGANYQYSRFFAGLNFGTDFIRFAEDVNTLNFSITLGYCF